jgi:vancomycin resistance protein YoaR
MSGSDGDHEGDQPAVDAVLGSGEAPGARGDRLTRGSFFKGSLLSVTALAVGAGFTFRGYLGHPGSGPLGRLAAAADLKPSLRPPGSAKSPPAVSTPDNLAGKPTDATPASPPPDPRVERALNARVHLQAGKSALWTELRKLGVSLRWSETGEPQWSIDERLFNRSIRRLARRVDRPSRSARLLHDKSGFHAFPARPGMVLDRIEARQGLQTALVGPAFRRSLEETTGGKPAKISLVLPLKPEKPRITGDRFGSINTLLAAYSTPLGGSSRNRRHNIQVACQAIDGTVLMPGDVFSYNDTVGPRTERAGFRTAPVIIHGELVPGTGGGICQVSSTLYNIALLGGLKIVRRSHHQFPVHYVPPGRDATVAYGSLDLRFANSLPHPVALDVKTAGSRVIVHLYGCADCKRDVRLVSSRVTWTRPRAPAGGGPARPGKRVTVSRVVRMPDGTERREVISHDSYAPAPTSAHSRSGSGHRSPRRRIHSRKANHNPSGPPTSGTTIVPSTPKSPL